MQILCEPSNDLTGEKGSTIQPSLSESQFSTVQPSPLAITVEMPLIA